MSGTRCFYRVPSSDPLRFVCLFFVCRRLLLSPGSAGDPVLPEHQPRRRRRRRQAHVALRATTTDADRQRQRRDVEVAHWERQQPASQPAVDSLPPARLEEEKNDYSAEAASSMSISPDSSMTTRALGLPDWEPCFSMASTTSRPSRTLPKTTCLPSSHAVLTVVMKNWDPFVSLPALAMLR
mmetsp:Transcript_24450/g.75519  ORF Transcript_24450/g.75519 Transcript_24450/m.75519 type:complete len:182 (-) Transcript_24450:422-967(-)